MLNCMSPFFTLKEKHQNNTRFFYLHPETNKQKITGLFFSSTMENTLLQMVTQRYERKKERNTWPIQKT